eukprot:g9837.t1
MSWISTATKAIIGKRTPAKRLSKDADNENQTPKTGSKTGRDSSKQDQTPKAEKAGGDKLSSSLRGSLKQDHSPKQGNRDRLASRRSTSEKTIDTEVVPKIANQRSASEKAIENVVNALNSRDRSTSSTLHTSPIDNSPPIRARSSSMLHHSSSLSSIDSTTPVRQTSSSMLHGATVYDEHTGLRLDNSPTGHSRSVSSARSSRTVSEVDLHYRASSSRLVSVSYASSVETTSQVIVNDLKPGSLCHLAGLQKGDIITHVNFLPVKTAQDVAKLVGDRDFHWLTVRRNQPDGLPPLVFNASTKPCPGSPPLPPDA